MSRMTKKNTEYEAFSSLAQRLLSVSHAEMKEKLDAEKKAKERKRKTEHAEK